ncbi:gliding motility-associated C-terminal domain-containing protein [Hymenobacter sp. BT683]|uniref:Gliding motility-associated C-terminal domain-containing protein n=1 Tax=Hymenobacter jeongseonensis TaxID=2791027 RepID=A0ABS0IHE8_9BACT|nr:gliding motility-associated C-terminal domain-containing protein [Hymenobacter jeongseonensis]MBF9237787.1 gliding motility-associated C-terminal domain-containing protein [Hymenobacter jeongseonensis]
MPTLLLRRFLGSIALLALFLLAGRPAQATHLLGGEMSYRYLDANGPVGNPFRYEITVSIYSNGLYTTSNPNSGIAPYPEFAEVEIYNSDTTANYIGRFTALRQGPANPQPVLPPVPLGCAVAGPYQPFYLLKYVQTVNLPASSTGYYAVYSVQARNTTITNIFDPGQQPLTLFVSMAAPLTPNRSPVFSDTAVAIICQNDTTLSLNNAFDPDGDRLVYSFGSPYGQRSNPGAFPPLPPPVPYNTGYSVTNPFGTGAGNFALINASTGVAKYGGMNNGQYVVAVDVSEYRTINGREVLIGTTRRDLQLVVSTCPPTRPPILPPVSTTPRSYVIEEGQTLRIPITATQPDGNHPLVMTVNSALLDGSGPFDASFNGNAGTVVPGNLTGTATATGTGSVSGTIVFNSVCGDARATAYDLAVTVKDNGCGGRQVSDVFRVTVNRAAGPTAINGPVTVCDPTTVRTYTATGPAAASYNWRVLGGTLISGQGTGTVRVTWAGTNTTGTLVLKGISARGCPTDSLVKTVDIRPLPALTVTATAPTICQGGTSILAVTGIPGLAYSWSGGGLSSTRATLTVSPTATTTYTVVGTDGTCTTSASVTVTVTPPPAAQAGADRSICPGTPSVPLGAPAVAGYTYTWSPATGLSNPNIAQPTVTLPNTTGAPLETVYTLTVATGTNCTSTSTVRVAVSPAAVADAGPALTTCPATASAPLGTAALPGYTYTWSPATGLSNPNFAQPTVTLPNATGAPITVTYTVTATSPTGCTATSVVLVTVSPAAVANPGLAVSFCSGTVSAALGGTAVAGTAYSWSPTTGLSNPNILNPTVTGTNTTGAPIVRTYTLTATTANGCAATSSVNVTINPAAVADAGLPKQTCSNVGVVIGGAAVVGTAYSWSPATGLSSASVLNPTVTLPNFGAAPITQVYTLTATTANGCVATATLNVTINPAAVADAGLPKQTCSNVGVVIGGAAVVGTAYSWSPATGLSSASVLNPTVTLPNLTGAPLTQQYILLATTANGCVQRDTVLVTINPAAVAVTGANQAVCSGSAIMLGAAPVAGYTYSWSPATGLSSANVANPTFTLTNTTGTPNSLVFTLTATTANGCVATRTVTVAVNPAAVAEAGPDAAVCDGQRLTLGTTARPGYTYSWSPATGLSSATTARPVYMGVNATATPLTRTFTVTATSAMGCVSTDAVTVTVNPRPAAEAVAGPVSVCPTVTGVAYNVPTPAASAYTWLIRGGTIASGQGTAAITVDWGTATTGAYLKVFRLNAEGCASDTFTLPIIINQRLQTVRPTGPGDIVAAAPLPRAVCQADGPFTYRSGAFANGSSYSWEIIGGTQVSTAQNTVTVRWAPVAVPTLGKIVVTETSNPAGGICRGVSDTLKVLINPSPQALALVGLALVCQTSGPVAFSLPGGLPGSTYAFALDGTPLAGTGNARTMAALPAPGTYVLTAQETTAGGCVGPVVTSSFTVSPTPVIPTVTGAGFVCDLATPQPFAVANPAAGAIFQWTVTGGTVAAGQGSSQISVLFGATGPYSVSAAETSASPALCAGPAATRTIVFDSPGLALVNASVDAAAPNNQIILSLNAPNSANTPGPVRILRRVAGTGTFAPVGTVAASATTYTDNNAVDAAANSYEYQLDLTDGCGTAVPSTVAHTIRLVASNTATSGGREQGSTALAWNAFVGFPVAEYRIYRRTDAGPAVLLSTVAGSTLQSIVPNAEPGSGISAGFLQSFRVVAVGAGTTPLLSNSNEASVNFENALRTYNIITPNRDGQNDVLEIDNIQLYPGNTFTVFNRWGREVYRTTNYQNNWGGDASISAGTYFYLLKLPNGTSLKNWFEVVK